MSSVARKDNAAVAIRRLDQRTVSRIAAGEVVQRPSAAVKELLENCIDAGATAIQITIKAGGIALIQIQDNGCGIRKDDLHIVCERFTTSKISAFEDLQSVRTFGFRGEALSSIAHVSRLTITTKTADSPCAYRAVYEDGRPLALPLSGGGSSKSRDQGGSAEPQPCAGVNGTIISVENLFYNMLARREAFKNPNEEYQRILDVVSKYSIHFAISNISFTCRKHGQTTPDLHTLSSNKTIDNIRQVYGAGVSKELLPLCIDVNLPPPSKDGGGIEEEEEEEEGRAQGGTSRGSQRGRTCMLRGFVSNASFSMRRAVYIFFINNRLVECASLRRLFDSVYADILPKGSAPFVYVAMDLPPAMLDVNVHPTKKEVIFLHESVIIDRLHRCMTDIFASSNQSRTFPIQTVAFPSSCSSRDSPRPLAACSLPAPIASPSPGLMAAALSPRSDVRELSHGLKAQYEFEDSVDEDEEGGVGEDEQEGGSGEGSRKRRRIQEDRKKVRRSSDPSAGSASSSASRAVAPNKLIRTDPSLRRIDHCFSATRTANIKATPLCVDVSSINACYCCNVDVRSCRKDSIRSDEPLQVISMAEEEEEECVSPLGRQTGAPVLGTAQPNVLPRLVDSKSQLISVANLVAEINENLHSGVVQILDAMTFVGAVDSAFILVQNKTKLLLLEFSLFLRQLFYQLAIRQFGQLPCARLSAPLPLRSLLSAAMEEDGTGSEDTENNVQTVNRLVDVLLCRREMLFEYFSIDISEDAHLCGLPELLIGYIPNPSYLPYFVLQLATKVDWEEEQPCFRDVAERLSEYFATLEAFAAEEEQQEEEGVPGGAGTAISRAPRPPILSRDAVNTLERLLLPAIRKYLRPQRGSELHVIELESLENMYKIFERC